MKLEWVITKEDIKVVVELMRKQEDNQFVVIRRERNLADTMDNIGKSDFWRKMIGTRLTSRQRSGPNSSINTFLREGTFPLSYDVIEQLQEPQIKTFITDKLVEHRGIRDYNKISEESFQNFMKLKKGNTFDRVLEKLNQLIGQNDPIVEREYARWLKSLFKGFGPKQSRNLLQSLGLTRYEIPLDSRITDWLNKFGFPIQISSGALADEGYYEFVLDGFQKLCSEADVYPCLLDAAIFSSYDGDGWTRENVVF